MNGFFITIIIMHILNFGYILALHGKERKDKYNFYTTFISSAIMLFLTYKAIY